MISLQFLTLFIQMFYTMDDWNECRLYIKLIAEIINYIQCYNYFLQKLEQNLNQSFPLQEKSDEGHSTVDHQWSHTTMASSQYSFHRKQPLVLWLAANASEEAASCIMASSQGINLTIYLIIISLY